jgi:hypothetical protein
MPDIRFLPKRAPLGRAQRSSKESLPLTGVQWQGSLIGPIRAMQYFPTKPMGYFGVSLWPRTQPGVATSSVACFLAKQTGRSGARDSHRKMLKTRLALAHMRIACGLRMGPASELIASGRLAQIGLLFVPAAREERTRRFVGDGRQMITSSPLRPTGGVATL